jgi:hypothetical protein
MSRVWTVHNLKSLRAMLAAGVGLVADSASAPTPAQALAFKAAGGVAWGGYIGKAGDDLENPWTAADFATIRAAGLVAFAFVSGDDDPAWVRDEATSMGVTLIILDVENGIRGDGAWVDPWLATSGAGIYGNPPVMDNHAMHGHPCYIGAAYPEDGTQTAAWPSDATAPIPARPMGWQWADNGSYGGLTVDLSNYQMTVFGSSPAPGGDADMFIQQNPAGTADQYVINPPFKHPITTFADQQDLVHNIGLAAYGPADGISQEYFDSLIVLTSLSQLQGAPGKDGTNGSDGTDGEPGPPGKPGPAGKTPSTATLSGPVKLAFSK